MKTRAIVLAAGKGTRMKSGRPKVLHELCGRPMIWYVLAALREAGISDVTAVVSAELPETVSGMGAATVVQEPQLGTGHAVTMALERMESRDGTILVTNGDMPLVESELFTRLLDSLGRNALALVSARMPLPSNFGRIIRDGERIRGIVEERDCTLEQRMLDEMNAGIYAFDEEALRKTIATLGNENAQREYYLTDTVAALVQRKRPIVTVPAADATTVAGINDREELALARAALNERLCRRYMHEGLTIIDPATTYLEPELEFGQDSVIYPNTTIGRLSKIGAQCEIGPNSRLGNAVLADGVVVKESIVLDTRVGPGTTIGPFAHLRSGNEIAGDVRVGNFVEVKSSQLRQGAKASHLSYIGDAEVGEGANIGAGTITCNFDGQRKNRTRIGKDASIGSNSSLVAPIEIGEGALTGAGSVVVHDVADGERVAGNPAKPIGAKKR